MKQLKSKKGMTLVEIIVVLLIMSIMLVIMGSLILNSFRYFDTTTKQDIDKRSLDSIAEYVRSELLYSTNVHVQIDKPNEEEDWNILSIVNNRLYKNGEQLYSDAFYNHNKLSIKIRGFDNYRLDLSYAFVDVDDKKGYSTTDTLELLNLKLKIDQDDEFNPFNNISEVTTIDEQMKIYYNKNIVEEVENVPEDKFSATQCLSGNNNRGRYKNGSSYKKGDMVYYSDDNGGYYFIFVYSDQMNIWGTPYHNLWWKRVSDVYDARSAYTVGDIFYYGKDGNYYKVIRDIINSWAPTPGSSEGNAFYEKITGNDDLKPKLVCSDIADEQQSVANELDYEHLNKYLVYEYDKSYDVGDIVYVSADDGYHEYYKKVMNTQSKEAPGTNLSSGWKLLTKEWDVNSAYKKGDVVVYILNSRVYYIEAQQDIDKQYNILNDSGRFNETYWKEVK